ncbi:acyl-CoA dehydrogenase family member 11-like [Glandiceps talaboti]
MYRLKPLQLRCLSQIRHKSSATATANIARENKSVPADTDNKWPFASARRGDFFQPQAQLENQYLGDATLRGYLKRVVPKEILGQFSPDLEQFGHRVATDIYKLGRECEVNPPSHQKYDAWGNKVDELIISPAWKTLHRISAEEGLVAIPYERKFGPWSRVYQVAKVYLFDASSGMYSCPLAMTDGALQTIDRIHENDRNPVLSERAWPRLISRDPDQFWTSGQWMTERKGGSDVAAGTQTLAVPQNDGTYKLYGYKWFSSATDANMSITLGRIVDNNEQTTEGTKGVSMFYLETRNPDGTLNGIDIQKLKNKLGTRQLPTAELLLDGTTAHLISEPGRGIAGITDMLTVSRIHNAIMALSGMRRMMNLARDYSTRRIAFGKPIGDHVVHMQTMARMEVEARGAFLMLMEASRLLGLDECKMASEDEILVLRILTPLMKLYTAKQAMALTSEGLECFGGQGYIEDTGLPSIFRDAQVLPIWEGTTNIMCFDVVRAITKTDGKVLQALFSDVKLKISKASTSSNEDMKKSYIAINISVNKIGQFLEREVTNQPKVLEVAGRDFAYSLSRTYIAALLLEHATWSEATEQDIAAAARWCAQDLCPVVTNNSLGYYTFKNTYLDKALVMDGYTDNPLCKM